MPANNNNNSSSINIGPNELRVLAFIRKDSPFEGLVAIERLNRGLPGVAKIDSMIAYRKLRAKGLLRHSEVVPVLRLTDEGLEYVRSHLDEITKHTEALDEAEGRA